MNKNIIITVITALIVGALSFYGGMKYQQSQRSNNMMGGNFGNAGQRQFNGGNAARNGNRMGARPTAGQIISADDNSITVKMADGSSKIVILSDKTTINKADAAAKSDLTAGTTVAVFGTDNTDGSVTAQNIQINPQFGNRGRDDNNYGPSRQPMQGQNP